MKHPEMPKTSLDEWAQVYDSMTDLREAVEEEASDIMAFTACCIVVVAIVALIVTSAMFGVGHAIASMCIAMGIHLIFRPWLRRGMDWLRGTMYTWLIESGVKGKPREAQHRLGSETHETDEGTIKVYK